MSSSTVVRDAVSGSACLGFSVVSLRAGSMGVEAMVLCFPDPGAENGVRWGTLPVSTVALNLISATEGEKKPHTKHPNDLITFRRKFIEINILD